MAFQLALQDRWNEETATDLLCQETAPRLQPIPFTRNQEALVGADWLWWFIDQPTGLCFGLLCQAKNLKKKGADWFIGVDQENKSYGRQMPNLLATADYFQVPAAYLLYCGTPAYRTGLGCTQHVPPDCVRCARSAVSVLSALAADYLYSSRPDDAASDAFRSALPLEDLADPDLPQELFDINLEVCGPELRQFLLDPQYRAPLAAKKIFEQLSRLRLGVFSRSAVAMESHRNSVLFRELPADSGHFSAPYFHHVLRGLRTEIPDYVTAALSGDVVSARVTTRAAGLVLVQM
ncbi:DUF6615 family protein [Streptomyces albicerus]|uniref:DUF6615 family protein n=1 Tax=Streptomyces albicerus TaxID=2569859 RepID=UPI00124AE57D|nr:DUF6615 family protein [Streptomyces albicerus]